MAPQRLRAPASLDAAVLRAARRTLDGKVSARHVRLVLDVLHATQVEAKMREAKEGLTEGFDSWPPPARAVWGELVASRTWRTKVWTHALLPPLAAAVAARQRRRTCGVFTVRRWIAWLTARASSHTYAQRCFHPEAIHIE